MSREDANDFDDKLLKRVRQEVPDMYKLIMLSVAEPRPWDTQLRVTAVFMRPWHLIAGYANPQHILLHEDYFYHLQDDIEDEPVVIHFMSLHEWITKMLEGNMDMYFAFRWWARAWFIDRHMRMSAQQLMQYCMSKSTIHALFFRVKLDLLFMKDEFETDEHKLSRVIFWIGSINYLLKRKALPKNHITATEFLRHKIIDDALFARYDNLHVEPVVEYLHEQIKRLKKRLETSKIMIKPDMPYISGSVHQLRLTYELK